MGQWRSLPSKEVSLETSHYQLRLGLLACFILHPPCFLKTLWLQGNPPTLWTIPVSSVDGPFSDWEHSPCILNSLFLSLSTPISPICAIYRHPSPVPALSRIPAPHSLLSITYLHLEDWPVCLTQPPTWSCQFPESVHLPDTFCPRHYRSPWRVDSEPQIHVVS